MSEAENQVNTPQALRFVRESGSIPGAHFTEVPQDLLEIFRQANCRLSWQRSAPAELSQAAGHHHKPVTRAMVTEMVGKGRAKALLETLYVNEEGYIVRGDLVLCARHNDAHEAEQEVWMAQAHKRLSMQDEKESYMDDVNQVLQRLRSEGVPIRGPSPEELDEMVNIPNAGDAVSVNKQPV